MNQSLKTAARSSIREARVVEAAETEAEKDVVAETANGVMETAPKLKVSIVVGVATTEALERIKMDLLLREKKLTAELATEAAAATMATVPNVVIVAAGAREVIEAASAVATAVAATEGAEIVLRRRVRPNQLSNNNKLSEHHREVNRLRSDEMKVMMGCTL